jgi:glycerophosphoryl diester phosphodiesterase
MVLAGCNSGSQNDLDVQGHRGARGLYPENTITGFIEALKIGVHTLEMDVVMSADGQVVVSHEPWMNHQICLGPEGEELSNDRDAWNLYKMDYEEIQRFDCGSLGNKRFPEQSKMQVGKPLLSDVIREAERYMKGHTHFEFDYNIEIKSSEKGEGIFHPSPEQFSNVVYKLIDQYLPWERVVIQSFDFRVLQYWNKTYPEVRLAALVENTKSLDTNLGALGFTPAIYSPYYKLMDKDAIEGLHDRGIKVIPWTVNKVDEMKALIEMGVDGIITDYPNRAAEAGLTLNFEDE